MAYRTQWHRRKGRRASRAGHIWEKRSRRLDVSAGKNSLTLDYTPGVASKKGAKSMQIGIAAKKIGLRVDAIRFSYTYNFRARQMH